MGKVHRRGDFSRLENGFHKFDDGEFISELHLVGGGDAQKRQARFDDLFRRFCEQEHCVSLRFCRVDNAVLEVELVVCLTYRHHRARDIARLVLFGGVFDCVGECRDRFHDGVRFRIVKGGVIDVLCDFRTA